MKEMFNYFVYIFVCFICYFLYIVYIVIIMIWGYLKNEYVLFDILGDINVLLFNK